MDRQERFPNYKISNGEIVSLSHIGPRLAPLVMSPWPLKMGKPTRSLAYLHTRKCGLLRPYKGMNIFECCSCVAWRKWLRKELSK